MSTGLVEILKNKALYAPSFGDYWQVIQAYGRLEFVDVLDQQDWLAGCWTITMRLHEGLQQLRHPQGNLRAFGDVAMGPNVRSGESSMQLEVWVRIPENQTLMSFKLILSSNSMYNWQCQMHVYPRGWILTREFVLIFNVGILEQIGAFFREI